MGHIAHLNNNRHDKISSGELKRSTLTLSIIFITFLHSFCHSWGLDPGWITSWHHSNRSPYKQIHLKDGMGLDWLFTWWCQSCTAPYLVPQLMQWLWFRLGIYLIASIMRSPILTQLMAWLGLGLGSPDTQ